MTDLAHDMDGKKLPDHDLTRIFALIQDKTGQDFFCYKASTIQRRMACHVIEKLEHRKLEVRDKSK